MCAISSSFWPLFRSQPGFDFICWLVFYFTFFLSINLLVKLFTFISKQCSTFIPAMHGGGSSAGSGGLNGVKLEGPGYYCNSYTPPAPVDHGLLSTTYSKFHKRY